MCYWDPDLGISARQQTMKETRLLELLGRGS